jgi:hypothetical protein
MKSPSDDFDRYLKTISMLSLQLCDVAVACRSKVEDAVERDLAGRKMRVLLWQLHEVAAQFANRPANPPVDGCTGQDAVLRPMIRL